MIVETVKKATLGAEIVFATTPALAAGSHGLPFRTNL